MRNDRNRKAFTIVEMVIVIAVIAVLAAVMIPTISGVIQMANVSADKQFAASLNIQLALWEVDNGEIASESDLRDAINDLYGELAEDGDYYAIMTTKSAKGGYYYWYDYNNGAVFVATPEGVPEELAKFGGASVAKRQQEDEMKPTLMFLSSRNEPISAVALASGNKKKSFADDFKTQASLRFDLVEGAYLMGGKGHEGSVLNIIADLEDLDDAQYYEDKLNELKNAEEGTIEKALFEKITVTTIETDYAIFACKGEQKYWYRSVTTTVAEYKDVYVYDPDALIPEKDGATGFVDKADRDTEPPIAVAPEGIKIELSAGEKVSDGAWAGLFAGKVEVHVSVTNKEELKDIFHLGAMDGDMVIVVPDGVLLNGNECYFNPDNAFEIVDSDNNPVVEVEPQNGMENLNVEIDYKNSGNPGDDADYFYGGTLYLAWDFGSASLSLKDNLSTSLVDWTVSDGALIQVSPKGMITLKEGVTPDAQKSFATITATLKKDSAKTYSINVQLVFPTSLTWKLDTTQYSAPVTNGAFTLPYTEATDFALALDAVGNTQSGYVKLNNTQFAINFATSGDLFKIENNTLKLDPAKIATDPTQQLTVTYGTADHTYISQTYTVTVKDNSSVGVEKNQIATGVTMGDYLFRVGNGNAFALGKLFSAVEAGKAVDVQAVNIYDASKSTGTNNRVAIAISGAGFTATYTANSNWADATVKFSGTGVAIIEVVTAKGATELAVEVVEGYNITDASQLKSNANNILLNDIKLASGGKFSLTGDAINHKVLYGNGFKFDITEATTKGNAVITLAKADLDNVRIIGKIYTTYQALEGQGQNEYYASAVYVAESARISNSYIFGTRSNIVVKADLEITNTVLDTARYANIDHAGGTLTINGLTTINEPREANGNLAGLGIVFSESATNSCKIVLKGDLTQHNWVCEADESKLPKVTGLSTFVDTIFETTEYIHTIDGVKYANLGIISMTGKVSMSNIAHPTYYNGMSISKLGYTGFVVSIKDANYDATAKDLTYRSNPYNWTPAKQAITVPTIKWTNHSSGTADVTFEKGQSGEFDPNVFAAQKYGVNLTHTITANGTNYTGKKITFTEDQTCVITYTVKDNKVYNNNGVATDDTETYTYTLVVNVVTTDPKQKEPEFNFTNATGTKEVVYNGKTYKVPEFTDSSKFFDVGNGIYAPIVEVKIKDNSSDFTGYYPIFGGVSITWYDAAGNATTYNSSSNLSAMPEGLEWITDITNLKGSKVWNGYKKYSSYGLCREAEADGSTNSSDTYKNVEFSFQAEGCEKYYYYIRFKEPAHEKPSSCVTGDTLVTLADGTQKEIQYVTYEDQLKVWNHFTGEYTIVPAAIIFNHGYDYNTVIKLNFSDGTQVKAINLHQFLNTDLKQYVSISADTVAQYVGHNFVKQDGDRYTTATLESYEISEEYVEAYGIISALHYNILVEGMFSTDFMEQDYNLFNYFTIGEGMVYDAEQMAQDIEKYGLYTYEDFADYLTYEQFVGFNVQYFKIAVGRGLYTYEGILNLINEYLNA